MSSKILYKFYRIFIVLIIIVTIYELMVRVGYDSEKDIKWGVAFSKIYATELGLDWREVYSEMIYDLGVKRIRLPIYWNDIEEKENNYDFDDYDWMMDQAKKAQVQVIPVVGRRLPRWPECHEPEWFKNLNPTQKERELLVWIKKVVNRYKDYDNIIMWQVENEPFLSFFGECEKRKFKSLNQEVEIVKTLGEKPVLVTDSGELSLWLRSSRLGDYLGTTVYRTVYNDYIGYWNYSWLPASFYRFKARLNFQSWDNMMISELQAEPWAPLQKSLSNISLEDQLQSMSVDMFQKNIDYAQKIGFPEVYLWGVEWWWFQKEKREDAEMWKAAKRLFKGDDVLENIERDEDLE